MLLQGKMCTPPLNFFFGIHRRAPEIMQAWASSTCQLKYVQCTDTASLENFDSWTKFSTAKSLSILLLCLLTSASFGLV